MNMIRDEHCQIPLMGLALGPQLPPLDVKSFIFIYSFITRFPIRRSGVLQQTVYGGPPACPVLGFPPPCN